MRKDIIKESTILSILKKNPVIYVLYYVKFKLAFLLQIF